MLKILYIEAISSDTKNDIPILIYFFNKKRDNRKWKRVEIERKKEQQEKGRETHSSLNTLQYIIYTKECNAFSDHCHVIQITNR